MNVFAGVGVAVSDFVGAAVFSVCDATTAVAGAPAWAVWPELWPPQARAAEAARETTTATRDAADFSTAGSWDANADADAV